MALSSWHWRTRRQVTDNGCYVFMDDPWEFVTGFFPFLISFRVFECEPFFPGRGDGRRGCRSCQGVGLL